MPPHTSSESTQPLVDNAEKNTSRKSFKFPKPSALAKKVVKKTNEVGKGTDGKPKKTNVPMIQRAKAAVKKVVGRRKTSNSKGLKIEE